jgi:hypothetical protein
VSAQLGIALADFVARLVLEATELQLPLAFAGPSPGRGIVLRVVEDGEQHSASLRIHPTQGPAASILAEGDARKLARCLREWARLGFATDGPGGEGGERLRDRVSEAAEVITGCGGWGAWARQLVAAVQCGQPLPPVGRRHRQRLRDACRALGLRSPRPWVPPILVGSERWVSETRGVIDAVRRTPPGSGVLEGLVLVSKPERMRRALGASIANILRRKGYRPRVAVLNAYKAGLSWLLEVVQPELKKLKTVARLELSFRPFSAAPDGLELESRFLQEIFPGPDLLAATLGIPVERTRLVKRSGLQDAYRVRAWGRSRRLLFDQGFTPWWTQMPYMPGRSHLGSVHPGCGGVRLSQNGRVILDERIPTDREIFWRIFQQRWLPAIEASMAARLKAEGGAAVFWEDMKIEVAIDETDIRLGLGEERVAPMEALHEDLYFVLLDFFRIFSQENGLAADVQFGRIFPRVLSVAPKGVPTASLTALPLPPHPRVAVRPAGALINVHSFRIAAGAVELGFTVPGMPPDPAEAGLLGRIARAWGLNLQPAAGRNEFCLRVRPPRARGPHRPPRPPASAPPLSRLIPLEGVEAWVQRLGTLPNLSAWRAGITQQGRPVWALEAVLGGAGSIASVARMRLLRPTLLVNARHHANEISSTNAVLTLFWELGTTRWGRRILKRVNVVAVPLENADGVATLEALLPGAADHKLHAARYNALGVEWYQDYFAAEPRFSEARVKPRLWRRWLPRVILDAHGVPSHEWDQPFSGYAPCRFRQYWIPRSFIYAVVPFINQPDHPGHGAAKALGRAMGRALARDGDVRNLNRALTARYRRYARHFEPETFPAAGGQRLVLVPPEERVAGTNYAVQRFSVTVSEIITEVTDEVVSGKLLELCSRCHLKAAKALLEFLGRQTPGRIVRTRDERGCLTLSWQPGSKGL